MNTFDAIAHIRRESLSRPDAMKYLMEHLGFNATYAEEIVAVIFERSMPAAPPAAVGDGLTR